ncbi:hypothetical protein Sjap_020976 [Stephania japonica]|uniref:Uncharacterized protein n=1 Tax=Stephania japonica TaxID=461633 RepID=A0AAP0HZG3_9MAGN
MAAALPGMGSIPAAAAAAAATAGVAAAASDDLAKKTRKPYTITKSRESWTEQEHDKFLEALQLFDRDWKKIEAFVGSKTVIQIRSHAQKYFLKVQKNGTTEHVPPPRPKRKAAHPYPQKATKNDDMGSTGPTVVNNCCSSTESTPRMYPIRETTDQGNHGQPLRGSFMPDFSQVYSFIGSVFDPNSSGHLQKLQKMDPIDVETRRLLSSYEIESEKAQPANTNDSCRTEDQKNIPIASQTPDKLPEDVMK